MALEREKILEALKHVYDPEIPVDIVNLGLVYEVAIEEGTVTVRMTTTAPGCPVGDFMAAAAERALRGLPGVKEVHVELVHDPPWSPELMSQEARKTLGFG
jgi:FeS assembly SUF system protein